MSSTAISRLLVGELVENSKKQARANKVVREGTTPLAAAICQQVETHLLVQAGTGSQRLGYPQERRSVDEKAFASNRKDFNCNNSLSVTKRNTMRIMSASMGLQSPKNSPSRKRSFTQTQFSRSGGFGERPCQTDRTNRAEAVPFIKLDLGPNDGTVLIPSKVAKEEAQEKSMRNKLSKTQQEFDNKRYNEQFQQQKQSQIEQKKQFLQEHPNTGFIFDADGGITLVDKRREQRTGPNKNFVKEITFGLDNSENTPMLAQEGKSRNQPRLAAYHQRIRAARGQAFASAVFQTVNMSRLSMNMSTNHIYDPLQFMRRNDLFNNNHSRQTTSIPYLSINEGTAYTELGTKESVSRGRSATSRSTSRNKFRQYTNSYRTQSVSESNDNSDVQEIGNTEYSRAVNHISESTAYVPQCSSSIKARKNRSPIKRGRIMTANAELVQSLIEG